MTAISLNWQTVRWLGGAELRAHPLRALLAIVAIATGVALGFAVHLINTSALGEFAGAIQRVSGKADLQVQAATAAGFDESLYARLSARPEIATASPVLELDVAVAGLREPLKIIGLDPLRAAYVTPGLIGQPDGTAGAADAQALALQLFDDDAIYVSPAALTALGKRSGDSLDVLLGSGSVPLKISGGLPGAGAGQRLASMDIAAAQWRLGRLGKLTRIDLKLAPGVDAAAFAKTLAGLLPSDAVLTSAADSAARTDGLSRAYRVNLDMLALMALFTGAFLVFSTQSLSVARRRTQLALLRVVGVTRVALIAQVLCEGAVLGVIGSIAGLGLGLLLADTALRLFGGDLGGGYFSGARPALVFAPAAALLFFGLGLVAALAGSLLPARAAARAQPAVALKAADDPADPRLAPRVAAALCMLIAGVVAAYLPPVAELPVFGYIAMALLLFGGIAAMPRLSRSLLRPLAASPARRTIGVDLALKRLWGAPTQATVALCGIVASASLMVAMAVMIGSFRQSVDSWLDRLLPADLYVRMSGPADSAGFDRVLRDRLAALPGVTAVEFLKVVPVRLAADRPAVVLLPRDFLRDDPEASLPLTTRVAIPPDAATPVWVSEAMVDLYGMHAGDTVSLPLATKTGRVPVFVAGVWRDYARQHGSVVMRDRDYTRLTGDAVRSDAAVHATPDTDLAALQDRFRAAVPPALAARLEFARPRDIRALSLKIFDRSFAVTYLLQAVAIAIGLIGVAATFSAQTLARAREFGMLRHVGVLRRQIIAMLACEGALLGIIGSVAGLALGLALSQVLIHVVNPQSFHWTMDTHVPWALLGTVGAALALSAAGTAVLAGRHALSGDALRAVREDW